MRRHLHLATHAREQLVDITAQVRAAVRETGIRDGLVSLYAQGATAAQMIFRDRIDVLIAQEPCLLKHGDRLSVCDVTFL